jgi:hypothetical protein
MKTVTEWFRELEGWRREWCCSCGGHGLVSAYTADGGEFLGAAECKTCDGKGHVFRSPRGALAKYPGGPFLGREAARRSES